MLRSKAWLCNYFPGECQMALCVGFVALAVLRSCITN